MKFMKKYITSHRSDKLACSRAACKQHFPHIRHYLPNSHTIHSRLGKRADYRSHRIFGIVLSFAVDLLYTIPIQPNLDSWGLHHPNTYHLDRSYEAGSLSTNHSTTWNKKTVNPVENLKLLTDLRFGSYSIRNA